MLTSSGRQQILGERPEAVERIAPDLCESGLVAQHVARYRWACRRIRGCAVADVTSGTGYGSELMLRAGALSVASVDASMEALYFGSERYRTESICADAHDLPLKDESLDAVVSLETIEHLVDPGGFATELERTLRPNGRLLLSTPNAEGGLDPNPYHLKEFMLDELVALLEGTGFRIHRVKGQHWRLPFNMCQTVKGIRRLAWAFERRPDVLPKLIAGSVPQYWCIEASK